MKLQRMTVPLLCVGISMASVTAEEIDCAALFTSARSALDARRFETSAAAFDKLATHCANAPNRPTERPFAFYQALARQLQAVTLPTKSDRAIELLKEAERLYHDLLRGAQDRATLSNLGLVYHALGRSDEAKSIFERALAEGGSNDPWYLSTYGRFLVEIKDFDAAKKYLDAASEISESSFGARIGTLELALNKDGPDAALLYVAKLMPKDPEQASRIVIESLSNPLWDTEHKLLAFSLAVSAMASELTRTPAVSDALAELLRSAERDEIVGAAARELSTLLSSSVVDTSTIPWWSARAAQKSPTDRPLWHGFRTFALAAGTIDARAGNYPVAKSKYSLVLKHEDPRVAVEPVLRLAELYAASGDIKAFNDFVGGYDAYFAATPQISDPTMLRKRFDYHREVVTLGDALLHSRCTTVTKETAASSDCQRVAKLIVGELDHAVDVAGQYKSSTGNVITVDGGAFSAAAQGHVYLDDRAAAATLRMTAASAYADAGRTASASRELERIRDEGLTRYMSPDQLSTFYRLFETTSVPPKK